MTEVTEARSVKNEQFGHCDESHLTVLANQKLLPLSWRAERLNASSAWWQHVPFAHWLISATAPSCLVELGTHTGVSYSAFCNAVATAGVGTRCYAVDTWRGDSHAGTYGEEVYQDLRSFHDDRYLSFSTLLRSTFDDAVDKFSDGSIDILHIDGCHTYEAARHDFETWQPKLSDRAVVLFHDTNEHTADFGVCRLWAELRERYPSFEFLNGHGLGVLVVGLDAPPAVRSLCALRDPVALAALRGLFARLGERWWYEVRERMANCRLQQQTAEADARAEAASKEISAALGAASSIQAEAERLRMEGSAVHAEAERLRMELLAVHAEAERLRMELSAVHAEAEHLRLKLESAKHAANSAEQELLSVKRALAASGRAQVEITAARSEASALNHALQAAHRELEASRTQFHAVTSSTFWRASAPVRRAAQLLPNRLRRRIRQVLHMIWWAITLQLISRLRARRQVLSRAQVVASSQLFDAHWYTTTYTDVAASGMPAALHYAARGGPEGRNPGPSFQCSVYLKRHPEAANEPGGAFLHALAHRATADGYTARRTDEVPLLPENDVSSPPTADSLLAVRFPALSPLPVFAVPLGAERRLTIVTDSINSGSLYGGVGTALILGAMAANRLGARLRLVTRTESPEAANLHTVLSAQGIAWDGNIEFIHAPHSGKVGGHDIPASQDDYFLTTSWWTTWSTRQSVPRARVAYLLQEDERMFYPHNDDHLRCSEVLSDPELLFIVNSELLKSHFRAEGLAPGAIAFEPAFPDCLYYPDSRKPRGEHGKKNLFFYARPHNHRNLYWRGLEALCVAIEENVLDPDEWDFHFAGHGAEPLSLPRGARPLLPGSMAWPQYAAMARRMDVGLCLMYTPHPSYPPMDLVASGAVVVTNSFGLKRELDSYSPNILCADLGVRSLVARLRDAKHLAADYETCAANLARSGLQRDWTRSLDAALERIADWARA